MTSTDTGIVRVGLALTLACIASCGSTEPVAKGSETAPVAATSVISGTAMYRERLALPPDAIFEALLEDVSLADAKSPVVARTTILGPSPPPIRFSISFDPSQIDSTRSYTVRARIRVDGNLWFASDAAHPVLTRAPAIRWISC